jgi:hypothetical protein
MDPPFTLVIATVWLGVWTTNEVWLPGYGEIECKQLAAVVARAHKRARCEREPDLPKGYVICPFGPPCWRNGRRCLDGALCQQLADD